MAGNTEDDEEISKTTSEMCPVAGPQILLDADSATDVLCAWAMRVTANVRRVPMTDYNAPHNTACGVFIFHSTETRARMD